MWLSEKTGREAPQSPEAGIGVVSIGGEVPAAVTDGEMRQLRLCMPGGYAWMPKEGETVLCVQDCLVGTVQPPRGLLPGEIRIETGAAAISLRADGSIRLTGEIYLNGRRIGEEEGN